MKIHPFTQQSVRTGLACAFAAITTFAAVPAQAALHVLQFTATTGANLVGNAFYLDNANLNGKPTAKLVVTQLFTTTANNHPIGVLFNPTQGAKGMWAVYNEDGVAMPNGASFNVLIGVLTSVHASSMNSVQNITFFPKAAGKPRFDLAPVGTKPGFLFFTHNRFPFPALKDGNFVNKNQSLAFNFTGGPKSPQVNKWYIANEDFSPALAASYFVFDASTPPLKSVVFGHTTGDPATQNQGGNKQRSPINNVNTDNKPNDVLFITPIGDGSLDKTVAVFYDTGVNKWTIFTEDITQMPAGKSFNVLVFGAPIP